MATHCQMAGQSRSGEHQHLGAVNCFEGQLQTKNLRTVVTCKMRLFCFTLFRKIHNICYMKCLITEFFAIIPLKIGLWVWAYRVIYI